MACKTDRLTQQVEDKTNAKKSMKQKKMKVLIIGNEGQLGTTLVKLSATESFAEFISTSLNDLDVTKSENVEKYLKEHKPDYIVNCTAYTAVVNAEFEQEPAYLVNARGPENIGKSASKIGARVIHISTDYVFDGKSNTPLTPEMEAVPQSIYGKTKLEGEQLLTKEDPNSIIIRTSWLYSPYGQNFFKTILSLGSKQDQVDVVYDQVGSPTYAYDLAVAIIHILRETNKDIAFFKPGIYHYSNEGVCSWFDFAKMIYRYANIGCYVNPVRTDSIKSMVHRPAYSVLDKTNFKKQFKIDIPYWIDSLENCIKLIQEINEDILNSKNETNG